MKLLSLLLLITSFASLQGCLNKQKLLDFPEAENQIITPSGRHFVTSGKGLAEIQITNGEYSLSYIDAGCDAYNGVSYHQGWIIVVCADNSLLNPKHSLIKGKLIDDQLPLMEKLVDLPNMTLPNGLVVAPDGAALYVADFVLLGRGKVSQFALSFVNNSPVASLLKSAFLDVDQGIYSPNGLKFLDGDLYLTDFNVSGFQSRLIKVGLVEQRITNVEVLYEKNTIFDDLLPTCGGVLVADFLNGRLLFVNPEQEVYESKFQEFPGISSMLWGQPPLFEEPYQMLITERGIIQDGLTDIGNQISLVPISKLLQNKVGAHCQLQGQG